MIRSCIKFMAFCVALGWMAQLVGGWYGEASAEEGPLAKPRQDVGEQAALFPVRTLYAPGHFGNSYEVMGEHEMAEVLKEAQYWGFNRYADWFDTDDCSDPFAETSRVKLAHALWDRKKAHFRTAQSLGLACDLVITPNHVYVDQVSPDVAAVQGGRIFGQLICPSRPQGREIILKNYTNLFQDLARAGVRLSAVVACPYDFGGCGCDQCRPWILTFAKLTQEIYAIGRKYNPNLELHMVGWWWEAEEHRLFAEWADREMPGAVRRMYLHIPYGKTSVADVPLPKGCERSAFVHIGYGDLASPRDSYFHLGPVAAPSRLEETVKNLASQGCTGVMAYSEGLFDDVNKAILAGLGCGKYKTAEEVLRAYAARYLGADEKVAMDWSKWLTAWGRPFEVDPQAAAAALGQLSRPEDIRHWRYQQWVLRCELFRLHRAIGIGDTWDAERLQKVEEFWAVQEKLYRGIWGLAPVRHVFARRYTPLPWYASWAKHQAEAAAKMTAEQ